MSYEALIFFWKTLAVEVSLIAEAWGRRGVSMKVQLIVVALLLSPPLLPLHGSGLKKEIEDVFSNEPRQATSENFCGLGQHREGQWVYQNQTMKKPFVCCSWDANDWRDPALTDYCTAPFNHEDHVGNDDVSHLNLIHAGGHACICDEILNTRLNSTRREKWIWKPNDCKLRDWDATKFCSALGTRKVIKSNPILVYFLSFIWCWSEARQNALYVVSVLRNTLHHCSMTVCHRWYFLLLNTDITLWFCRWYWLATPPRSRHQPPSWLSFNPQCQELSAALRFDLYGTNTSKRIDFTSTYSTDPISWYWMLVLITQWKRTSNFIC